MHAGSQTVLRGNRNMLDKALAIISIFALIAFMGIVLWFINEIALWVIVCAVLAMAAFDFYRELWGSG